MKIQKHVKFRAQLPVAFGNVDHFGLETVGVVAFVTAVAQQQFVLVLAGRTKLAIL